MDVDTAFNLGMTTNATEIEPDKALGKRPDDCSTKKLENLTYETVSDDIKIDKNKYTSSNKEITTSQTENKKFTDLTNIEATNTLKCEGLNFKGVIDVVRPGDNKDTTANTVFNSRVNRISEIKINSTLCESAIRDLETEHPISEENSDNIKPPVNKNITSFTGLSLDATPISSEERIDTARGISFTASTDEFKEFSLGQSAEFATNETNYSDSNSEKDSTSKTNCSLKFKEESFCGEKTILAFGNQNATDTLKIKNLNLGTSFDSSKSIDNEDSMSKTKINRGLVQTSLGENTTFDLVNSTVSENSSSISAAKFVDPDVDKVTTYSGFNLVTQENASGKISDSTLENSSTVNSVKLEGFTSTIAVKDISSTAKDKIFKDETVATTSSEEKSSIPLGNPSGKSPLKPEALETNGKSSDDAKTVSNKDTISNSERINFRFNFGLKSNSSGEKSPTDSKNSSISSNKELGNLFSKFYSDRAKADTSKNSTSVSESNFGIKQTISEEKSAIALENPAASDGVEPKKSFLVSDGNNSLTLSTKEDGNLFSRLTSDGDKPDTNKSITPNFNFSFGIKPPLVLEKPAIPLEKPAIPLEKSAIPLEKSAIPLENLAASNAIEPKSSSLLLDKKNSTPSSSKEDVSLFSSLYSDGAKPSANKSSTPNFNRSFGIEPSPFSEKSSIALENSAASNSVEPKISSLVSDGENSLSNSKENGKLFSKLASNGAKHDTCKSTAPNFNFSFGIKPTLLEKNSDNALENLAASNNVEPKSSSLVSDERNSLTLSTKEDGSLFSRFVSDGAKPDTNKSTTPNIYFNFGKPPTPLEEKPPTLYAVEPKISSFVSDAKNFSTSSTEEHGSTFSTLSSNGAKHDTSKSVSPNSSFSFGIKPALFSEKSAIPLENLPASNAVEPKSSSLVSNEKYLPTSRTKEDGNLFSTLASDGVKSDANKNATPNFNFGIKPTFLSEKPSITLENSAAPNRVEPKISSFASDGKNSLISTSKENGNLFLKLINSAKPDTNRSTTPNFNFGFGIKPTLLVKNSGIENLEASNNVKPKSSSFVSDAKNLSTSSTEEHGSIFSRHPSNGAKPDANKSVSPNFSFGIKPALFLGKTAIPLENLASSIAIESKSSSLVSDEKNSSTSSVKEDGKLFSTLASDGAKSAENKSTTPNFNFNFGNSSTPMEEKLPALYAIEPKISSFVPDAKNLSTSSTKEHGSIFSRLPSNGAKPDADKNVSPNFSFGIKPAVFSEKAAIPFENLAASNAIESKSSSFVSNGKNSLTSSAKEDGKLFSTLASGGAKSAENRSTFPNSNFNFGIKPALFSEKSAIGFANSAALSSLEPKSSSLVSGILSSPTPNIVGLGSQFAKVISGGSKTDLSKNTTPVFDFRASWNNFKYGPRLRRKAVRKIIKETTPGSTSALFTFGSMNDGEKSQANTPIDEVSDYGRLTRNLMNYYSKKGKTSESTSTGFTFTYFYPKFQEKTSGITSTGFTFGSFDPKSQEKTSGITSTGFTFGSFDPKYQGPGTSFKFSPAIGTDTVMRGGVATTISTRHQYITSMKEYLQKSFEELRLEDYKWCEKICNPTDSILQKGGLSFPNSDNVFENTNTTRSNFTFGATETSGVSELLKGLEELLLSGKHSDVTLTVQDKEFNAHRVILGIRSPVFSAMMEHETKEKATGVVNIPDCEPDPFFDFLHFLYTGSTKNVNSNNVLDLYTIADKYQVPELCKICVNYMKRSITLQSFCDILTLSLRHHERELTDVATKFFLKNSTEIALTVSWSLFVKENPVAANELFLKALNLYKK